MINKKVIRRPIEKGKFTTFQHSILYDKRLTADDKIILTSILADADNFNVTHELLLNRFDLSENTLRKIFKNLEQCGYLMRTKLKRGNYYTISEFGNLNGTTTDSNVDTVVSQPQVTEEVPQPIQEPIQTNEQKLQEQHDKHTKMLLEYTSTKDSLFVDKVNFDTFIELVGNHLVIFPLDFYVFKNEAEKFLTKIKIKFYKEAEAHAEANNYHKNHKALKLYKGWIKTEIFDNNNLKFKYDTMWRQFQQQNRKQDVETLMADKLEQMYCDGEGND